MRVVPWDHGGPGPGGVAQDKPNPHDSHFPGLECTFCHHVHEPSYDFCLECHDFGYQIP